MVSAYRASAVSRSSWIASCIQVTCAQFSDTAPALGKWWGSWKCSSKLVPPVRYIWLVTMSSYA